MAVEFLQCFIIFSMWCFWIGVGVFGDSLCVRVCAYRRVCACCVYFCILAWELYQVITTSAHDTSAFLSRETLLLQLVGSYLEEYSTYQQIRVLSSCYSNMRKGDLYYSVEYQLSFSYDGVVLLNKQDAAGSKKVK